MSPQFKAQILTKKTLTKIMRNAAHKIFRQTADCLKNLLCKRREKKKTLRDAAAAAATVLKTCLQKGISKIPTSNHPRTSPPKKKIQYEALFFFQVDRGEFWITCYTQICLRNTPKLQQQNARQFASPTHGREARGNAKNRSKLGWNVIFKYTARDDKFDHHCKHGW
jgi:hypothetical protein